MKQVILPILVIVIAAAAFVAYITAEKAIRMQAIDGCLRAGTSSFTNGEDVNVTVPDEYSYNLCMERKGLK